MKARALLLGIALVFFTGSQAFAMEEEEEEIDATLPGWYIGGSAGGAVENFSGGVSAGDGFGGDITFGYRASEYLSFEIETEFLENFQVKNSGGLDIWTSTLNFRVHFPIEDTRIEPYLTYGVGAMDVEAPKGLRSRNDTDIMMKGGLGIAYQLTNAVSLYANGTYALPFGNIKDYDHVAFTAGFLYKFAEDE